nr:putative reverse transcriptase domain-containing protein [Tanacetum cinerariifolium]
IVTDLLRKEKLYAKFSKCEFWLQEKNQKCEKQEEAFQTLKDNLCNAPILSLPDGVEDFMVYCDASNQGLGCVLIVRRDGVCAKDAEALFLFSDYECEIKYHPGKENVVAEPLSRKERVKPRRVRAMAMTIQFGFKGLILAAQGMDVLRQGFGKQCKKALGTRLDMSTAYHPQMDGQSEQISYNNSYHSSIRCAPFEVLYGRKCRSSILWAEIGDSRLIRPELVQETTDKVVVIRDRLKAAKDHVVRFGNKEKLAARFVGPFEILERIGPMAYRLRLPKELSSVHDTFHVSNLKKCLADANFHMPLDEIRVDKTLRFVEEPLEIINREVKSLKHSKIPIVKVRWNSKRGAEFTWERKDHMKAKCPQLFENANVETNG